MREIVNHASADAVIDALELANAPLTRHLLFDVLGEIRAPESVRRLLLGS